MSEPFEYQNSIGNWLLNNICFSLRIDIPTRPNLPYNTTKFAQELRQICYQSNLNLLGKSKFRRLCKDRRKNNKQVKYDKHINEYELVKDRFFLFAFEEGKEQGVENHYHLLCHVPVEFRGQLSSVIEEYYGCFWSFSINPYIDILESNSASIKYDSKETYKEWKNDIQKWFLSYQ